MKCDRPGCPNEVDQTVQKQIIVRLSSWQGPELVGRVNSLRGWVFCSDDCVAQWWTTNDNSDLMPVATYDYALSEDALPTNDASWRAVAARVRRELPERLKDGDVADTAEAILAEPDDGKAVEAVFRKHRKLYKAVVDGVRQRAQSMLLDNVDVGVKFAITTYARHGVTGSLAFQEQVTVDDCNSVNSWWRAPTTGDGWWNSTNRQT